MATEEIGGRYSIIERIGKGAMGVVYKAYDPVLDRVVAIKKMVQEIGQDEELRQRFYVEARAAARLNHRNIVTIHELEEADGEIYIVMEMLEGVDLASIIRRRLQLPLPAKLDIVAQLCEGLDYAHRHGIVHRDIKPGNMHLSPSGLVKILDFGIARLASSKMTGTGALLGTPDYMSPEQVMGEDIDARSDLFAVGGVLYELLVNAKAFESDTVASLLIKIAKSPHVPITDRAADLPVPLVSLVNRLLAKERDLRPDSAGVVAAELRAFMQASASDAPAAALIGGIVTEATMAIGTGTPMSPSAGTPRPTTPRRGTPRPATAPSLPADGARTASKPQESTSNARLASLALQRGRELRKNGDLAGAIEVFRSVLEVAPGNPEALEELQALEADIRQATAKSVGRATAEAEPTVLSPRAAAAAPPAASVAPASAAPAAATAAPPVAPAAVAGPPVAPKRSGAGLVVAATLLLVAAAGGAAYYLLVVQRGTPAASATASPSKAAPAAVTPTPAVAVSSTPAANAVVTSSTLAPPAPAVAETTPPASPAPSPAPAAPAVDPERAKAEAARDRLADAKQARIADNAGQLPVRLRNEATRFERQGTTAFNDGQYARAATLFDEAGRLVGMRERPGRMGGPGAAAPEPANSNPTTPATSPVASQPRPEPGAPPRPDPRRGAPPPDRADDPPPMRPMTPRDGPADIGAFNRAAPTSVEQMFNAAPSTRATLARITDAIERYGKAMEQKNGEAVRELRDQLNPLEQRLLRSQKPVSYKLEDISPQSNGQEGFATARRTVSGEAESGEKITLSGPVTIRLTRTATRWVITDIR